MESDIIIPMDRSLLASIEGKKRELDRLRPLPPSIVKKLKEQFLIEWTYNSNAIEGNTLSLQETELVLNRGLTIGNKSLKEHFEAINHKECIELIEEFVEKKKELNTEFIKELHKIILKNIDDYQAGVYRKTNVRILGAVHIPPDATKIERLMDEFLEWYYSNKHTMSVPELAAWVQYKFVWIHPFIDGNGRTARLLMNLVLLQNGYPPAVILNLDRQKYYRVLRQADMDKPKEFMNFIGRSIERSLVIYLNSVTPASKKKEHQGYISLKEATKYCNYSLEYLSLLARTGKLPAIKFERNWMTTREAIDNYLKKIEKKSRT
jgi:Fic family protein